jgi:hypothetical protein
MFVIVQVDILAEVLYGTIDMYFGLRLGAKGSGRGRAKPRAPFMHENHIFEDARENMPRSRYCASNWAKVYNID